MKTAEKTVKEKKSKTETKQELLAKLSKDFPLYDEGDYVTKVEAIPSGSLALDMAIGVGGYPRGAIIDVFGQESAGKSLLSILAMAELQKMGGSIVVWDA